MSSINQFPFQDPILRRLLKGPGTPSEVAHSISEEGHAPGHDHDSEQLHRDVARTSTTSCTSAWPSTRAATAGGRDANPCGGGGGALAAVT